MYREIIKLPHGYEAEVRISPDQMCPFENTDGEPPIVVFYDGRLYSPGSADRRYPSFDLGDLFDLLSYHMFDHEDARSRIAKAFGIDMAEVKIDGLEEGQEGNPEEWKEEMFNALPVPPTGWHEAGIYMGYLCNAADILKRPYLCKVSTGHSQGHTARVFVWASKEWQDLVGAPDDDLARQCESAFDMYTAWAWGDIYYVESLRTADGVEVEYEQIPDACGVPSYDFYGFDHEKSGLVQWAKEAVEEHLRYVKKETDAAHEAACRDIATV